MFLSSSLLTNDLIDDRLNVITIIYSLCNKGILKLPLSCMSLLYDKEFSVDNGRTKFGIVLVICGGKKIRNPFVFCSKPATISSSYNINFRLLG